VEQAQLLVAPKSLTFGAVFARERFQWTFDVANPSDHPVEVQSIEISCGCTKVQPERFIVLPRSSATVTATLNVSQTVTSSFNDREFSVNLVPHLAGRISRHSPWKLRGTVLAPIRASPPVITLSNVVGAVDAEPEARITVEARGTVVVTGVKCDDPIIAASVGPIANSATEHTLVVHLKPHLAMGRYTSAVRLAFRISPDGVLGEAVIPVVIDVASEIEVTPEFIALGPIDVGRDAMRNVEVRSLLKRNFVIEGIEQPNINERCDVTTLIPGGVERDYHETTASSQTVSITCRPRAPGLHVVEVRCLVADADGVRTGVPIKLTCIGLVPRDLP
jgi:hypothetical protein